MPGQGPRRRLAKDAIVLDATLGAVRITQHGIARRVLPVLAATRSSRSRFESLHLATDFLTVDAWTLLGLVRYYVLVFIHLGTRQVEVAGVTRHPTEEWMAQVARNVTMEGVGFLSGMKYLLHDRDTKFSEHFRRLIRDGGVRPLVLPARSPNLNAFVERWIRTVKNECLDKLIFFGRASVERALNAYVDHYHSERNHQGIGNVIPMPRVEDRVGREEGRIVRRRSLGGLLSFHVRRAG